MTTWLIGLTGVAALGACVVAWLVSRSRDHARQLAMHRAQLRALTEQNRERVAMTMRTRPAAPPPPPSDAPPVPPAPPPAPPHPPTYAEVRETLDAQRRALAEVIADRGAEVTTSEDGPQ